MDIARTMPLRFIAAAVRADFRPFPVAQAVRCAKMFRLRTLAIGVVTIVLLVGALLLTRMDFAAIAAAAGQLTAVSLLTAAMLLVAGALLAVVRLWWISDDIGTPLSFRDAMLALSLGQIAGAISVQFFGQIAARSALLGRRGVSNSANIVMATYERAAAVFVSAAMAVSGAVYLFGKLSFDVERGGAQFLTIIVGITCIVVVGAVTVWGRFALPIIRELMTPKVAAAVSRNALLTAAIQLCTAGAYVAIARSVSDSTPIEQLFAASLVVMFAASLPISFSGWGLREISAVFVLGAIGISAPAALTIALVIGALAFAAVIFVAGAAVASTGEMKDEQPRPPSQTLELATLLKWTLPIAAATAVFFQIYIPTGATNLSVNLADPIAVLGGLVFVSEYGKKPQWRMPWIPLIAGIATLVLLLSYIHGYFAFGSNQWASINRMLGWLIVLCYVMTGALVVAHAGEKGAVLFARTFVVTACSIVLFWSVVILANRVGVVFPKGVLIEPLSGFSQNRNAFAFSLLMAICALPFLEARLRIAAFTTLAFGLWLAGSYAAYGTFATISVLSIYFGVMSWRAVLVAIGTVALTILIFYWAPHISSLLPLALSGAGVGESFSIFPILGVREASNHERLASLQGGLSLFLSHPIFGAGLGQFVETQTIRGVPLVIHSTPIWLLAETGLIGLLAFAGPAAWLFFKEYSRRNLDPTSQIILLALTAFSIMSQVHDLLFQRSFWLLLGVTLLIKASPQTNAIGNSNAG